MTDLRSQLTIERPHTCDAEAFNRICRHDEGRIVMNYKGQNTFIAQKVTDPPTFRGISHGVARGNDVQGSKQHVYVISEGECAPLFNSGTSKLVPNDEIYIDIEELKGWKAEDKGYPVPFTVVRTADQHDTLRTTLGVHAMRRLFVGTVRVGALQGGTAFIDVATSCV